MNSSPPAVLDFGECPYLPERRWHSFTTQVFEANEDEINLLIESGFRRLGHLFYSPLCPGCEACISLRIPTDTFQPNKNQRQIWRRNQDLEFCVEPSAFSQELFDLYSRYQQQRWNKQAPIGPKEFCDIYMRQPGRGLTLKYRLNGQLVGADLMDVSSSGLSSVYFVWECESRRSLGIYSVMKALEWCRESGLPYLYLGLYVEGNDSMRYKASFHPHQRRYRGGQWIDQPDTGWPLPKSEPKGVL